MMAMGGFGRETMNALVINMVYVQPECRGTGVGRMLVYELVKVAEKWDILIVIFSLIITGKKTFMLRSVSKKRDFLRNIFLED